MPVSKKQKKVLVLLIGEILEDPRVYKTCMSLCEKGVDVTVACTNPSMRQESEIHNTISIIRFPHPEEFFLKRFYTLLQGKLHPGMGQILSRTHEEVPTSSFKAAIRNFVLNLNNSHFMKSNLKINCMMAGAFTDESFDMVHCNDVDTLFAGSELRRKGAAKALLYDSHEYWAGMGIEGSRSNIALREAEADGIQKADFVVTVNPIIANLLMEQYNLKKSPSVVMNCPYRYDGEINVDDVHTPVRIIFQGKMQAYRGLVKLIYAFKHIKNGVLTMSGYGPLKKRLELIVEEENISNKIFFTDRYNPEDSIKILRDHDIGIITYEDIIPNNIYSSPNKLFEYAMAGLALATSNFPFLAKVIKENDMGKLIEKITPESIAETLNSMISDTEQLKQYKKNARKTAEETFCWEEQFWENYPFKP